MNVINLNKVRKARAKAEAKTRAAENRAAFGRSKDERTGARKEIDRADKDLDGKKRED